MIKRSPLLLIFVCIGLLHACYYDVEETLYPPACDTCSTNCDTDNLTYSLNIEPIISTNCSDCHYGAAIAGGGTSFDTQAKLSAVINDPANRFLCRINWDAGCVAMPLGGSKLPACTIQQIETWINNGMP